MSRLYRHVPLHVLAVHLTLESGRDHFAARQHNELIRQCMREVEILLAQQDGHVAAFAQ
jgi:hypothetical protein